MKKIISILVVFLCAGCLQQKPNKQINPKCDMSPDAVQVFQVLEKGVLVKKLKNAPNGGYYVDDTLYYVDSQGKEWLAKRYDKEQLLLDTGCFEFDGTYSYNNVFGAKQTIRKLKYLEDKYLEDLKQ